MAPFAESTNVIVLSFWPRNVRGDDSWTVSPAFGSQVDAENRYDLLDVALSVQLSPSFNRLTGVDVILICPCAASSGYAGLMWP